MQALSLSVVKQRPQFNQWWIVPVALFIITRIVLFTVGYVAEVSLIGNVGEQYYHVAANNILIDVWARWDSGFYIDIAKYGYQYVPGQQSSVAFFPIYPLLISWLTPILGSELVAGIVVSNLALLGALLFLYRLTLEEFGDAAIANRAVFYILAFPTAFFFTAVYTESVFLLFAVGTMYFARKRVWMWAILFGMLCSGTRIVGILMYGVVGLEWLNAHGWYLGRLHRFENWKNLVPAFRHDWQTFLLIQIIPLGLVSYMFFLYQQFNDPVAFSTVQSAWGRELVGPWTVVYQELARLIGGDLWSGDIWYHVAIDLGCAFLVFASVFVLWRKLGESYAMYSILAIAIPLSSGSASISRYILAVFPFFMLLAYYGRNRILNQTYITLSLSLLGIFTTLFVNWIFIA